MATNAHTAAGRGESSSSRGGRGLGKSVAAAVNTDTLIDLMQRLGLVDMVVDKIRARLQESDIDDVLDEAGDYLKRNPEAIVVGLGAATIAAGVLVFLHSREEGRGHFAQPAEDREAPINSERETRETRESSSRPRSTSSTTGARRRPS